MTVSCVGTLALRGCVACCIWYENGAGWVAQLSSSPTTCRATTHFVFHCRLATLLFSKFPSLFSPPQAYLLEFDHSVFGSHWR